MTALAALGALAWHSRTAIGAGATLLFSRLRADSVLDHPLRSAILEAVRTEPGIHLEEILRRLGKAHGTVRHHVEVLVQAGLVARQAVGGYTFYYADQPATAAAAAASSVLKAATARRLLRLVQKHPGITVADASRRTGMTYRTMQYHLQRMQQAGLLRLRQGQGGAAAAFPEQNHAWPARILDERT